MNASYLATSIFAPCPEGQGIGVMNYNGTSFLICNSTFPYETASMEPDKMSLYISLGVGIGFGVSVFAFTAYKYVNSYLTNRIYRKKSHLSDSSDESDA